VAVNITEYARSYYRDHKYACNQDDVCQFNAEYTILVVISEYTCLFQINLCLVYSGFSLCNILLLLTDFQYSL
jgi:hypothetical protein